MGSLIGFLPFLILLACPLMMGFCFWSMRRMGSATDEMPASAESEPAIAIVDQSLPLAEQISGLQHRLEQLKDEQDAIAVRLAEQAWVAAGQDTHDRVGPRLDPGAPAGVTSAQN